MICRRCLHRASSALSRPARSASLATTTRIPLRFTTPSPSATNAFAHRTFATTPHSRSSEPAPTPPSPGPEAPGLTSAADEVHAKAPLSSCPEGTTLNGLNYFKNKNDPQALADDAYPAWLWQVLDTDKAVDMDDVDEEAAEFSKSKKLRRLAAKKARAREARILAEGNLEALAPKIPVQQQTVNLPGKEGSTPEESVAANTAREELRRAMHQERRAKIKEDNYLKSM